MHRPQLSLSTTTHFSLPHSSPASKFLSIVVHCRQRRRGSFCPPRGSFSVLLPRLPKCFPISPPASLRPPHTNSLDGNKARSLVVGGRRDRGSHHGRRIGLLLSVLCVVRAPLRRNCQNGPPPSSAVYRLFNRGTTS